MSDRTSKEDRKQALQALEASDGWRMLRLKWEEQRHGLIARLVTTAKNSSDPDVAQIAGQISLLAEVLASPTWELELMEERRVGQ